MPEQESNKWITLSTDIENEVKTAYQQLITIADQTASQRINEDEWSIKEIIGHLIDSASNNHQRFVRLQVEDDLSFPNYAKDNTAWVVIQNYQASDWKDLLGFWCYFNLHLANVIRNVDEACIDHIWAMDEDTTITLGALMIDYLRHLKDHIEQIQKKTER